MDSSSKRPRVKRAWVIAGVTGAALIGGGTAAIAATGQGHDGPAAHVSVVTSTGSAQASTPAPVAPAGSSAAPAPVAPTVSARSSITPAPAPTSSRAATPAPFLTPRAPSAAPTAVAMPAGAEPPGDNDSANEDDASPVPTPTRAVPVPATRPVPAPTAVAPRPTPTSR